MTASLLPIQFESLLGLISEACQACYGDRLVSLAVFGSVGRGTPRPDSDIDLLLVVERLPRGRMPRMAEFLDVEAAVRPFLDRARATGFTPELSPIIRLPEEILKGSPLLLDMIEDAKLLHDRQGFLKSALERFKARLDRLGARRIWRGNAWYWDLNPGYRHGDIFEL